MQRTCIGCGQTDNHPKHRIALGDGNEAAWHMDCHARSGDGCESCAAQKEGAEHLVGEEFRAHIHGLGDDFHQQLMSQVNGA